MSGKNKHNKYTNCKWNRLLTKIPDGDKFKNIENNEHYVLLNIHDKGTREKK